MIVTITFLVPDGVGRAIAKKHGEEFARYVQVEEHIRATVREEFQRLSPSLVLTRKKRRKE